MFDQTIRQLLSLFPRGATDDQLIWRLSASGIRLNASELLAGLGALAERGEVIRDPSGRWQVARTQTSRKDARPQGRDRSPAPGGATATSASCPSAPRKAKQPMCSMAYSTRIRSWISRSILPIASIGSITVLPRPKNTQKIGIFRERAMGLWSFGRVRILTLAKSCRSPYKNQMAVRVALGSRDPTQSAWCRPIHRVLDHSAGLCDVCPGASVLKVMGADFARFSTPAWGQRMFVGGGAPRTPCTELEQWVFLEKIARNKRRQPCGPIVGLTATFRKTSSKRLSSRQFTSIASFATLPSYVTRTAVGLPSPTEVLVLRAQLTSRR